MKKILLVEDALETRYILSMTLQKYGYEVITADNGKTAWEILQQQTDIQLVLSDWMMPIMDGIQLCQAIRNKQNWHSYIYFILLTANCDEDAVIQGMEAGADDFLLKPVNLDELRVRLNAGKRIIQLEKTLESSKQKIQDTYDQISTDLQSAANMQQALLPKPGRLGQIQFDWIFCPYRFVAGDMFNYFELNDTYLGFYQLDVAGHGVSSALLSFTVHHRIVNHLLLNNDIPVSPEEVVAALNEEFQNSLDNYFTMIYGYINKYNGKVCLTQAGHPKPILVSNSNAKLYGDGGYPVGMLPDLEYQNFELQLEVGDRFFIYSDGVTECMNSYNQQFSESRFVSLLEKYHKFSLEILLKKIGIELRTWRNQMPFDDDVTLLAFERIA
jgi:sigma-B regulation protein RsbU (phosphoserine phosphatase)